VVGEAALHAGKSEAVVGRADDQCAVVKSGLVERIEDDADAVV
jgi:hypothetical protein